MRATLTAPPALPLRSLRWPLLAAAAIIVVALIAAGGRDGLLFGGAVLALGITAAVVDRRFVVPLAIALIPLEILQEATSTLDFGGIADRVTNSTLLSVRLAIVGIGVYWVITARPGWERLLPRGGLLLPAFLLLIVYVFGALHTFDVDPQRLEQREGAFVPLEGAKTEAVLSIAALALHLALLVLIPMLVRDWATLRLCVWTFVAVAVALALAGIYQQVTGTFFWNPDLGLSDVPRINATFRDPNIYARMLLIAMLAGIAISFSVARAWRLPLLLSVLVPCSLALIFTNSRSGLLLAATLLPLTVLFMPLPARMRIWSVAGSGVAMLALLFVAVTVFDAAVLDRIATLGSGSDALGVRQSLIEGGWQMFLDHPVFGVGLAGFQDAFQGPYHEYYDRIGRLVSLSHTDAITVLAELGIVGAVVVAFLFLRFASTVLRVARATDGANRALVTVLGLAVLAILLSAQSEGRLLSDPYLWVFFGLALAAEEIVRRRPEDALTPTEKPA